MKNVVRAILCILPIMLLLSSCSYSPDEVREKTNASYYEGYREGYHEGYINGHTDAEFGEFYPYPD